MADKKALALGFFTVGFVFVYGGFTGRSPLLALQSLVKGDKPSTAPVQYTIDKAGYAATGATAPTGQNPDGASEKANQALGRSMAALYGWGMGAEWTALNDIVMSESGWSDTVTNPSSDAAGIAQNIDGFGPGYESGNASQQIAWMLSYIKGRYNDPIEAWNFHMANGYY